MPELDYAVLAEYVRAEPNGIAHVIGAGVDTVHVPAVPAGMNLGLLARFTFARNECGREYPIEIIFQDIDGARLVELRSVVAPEWPEGLPPGWSSGAMLGVQLGVPVPTFGIYSFDILLADRLVKTIPLRVVEQAES